MNKVFLSCVLFLGIQFFNADAVFAQQKRVMQIKDAVLKLKEAEDLFTIGHFDEALVITSTLMKDHSLTRTEKEQALLITAKINLELDKIDTVQRNIESILRLSPNYKLNPVTVQQDLEKYFDKYYVIPRFSFSAMLNGNIANFKTINQYGISERLDYSKKYGVVRSWGRGGAVQYSFRYHFFVEAGVHSNIYRYSRDLTGADSLNIVYQEQLTFWEIPVSAGKRFQLSKKYDFYMTAALQGAKMFVSNSTADIKATFPVYESSNNHTVSGTSSIEDKKINRISERKNNIRYGMNMELNKRFNNLMFGAGLGYYFTYQPANIASKRYSDENLIYNYNFLDDDFRFDYFQYYLTVSYTVNYAIKKKQVRIN